MEKHCRLGRGQRGSDGISFLALSPSQGEGGEIDKFGTEKEGEGKGREIRREGALCVPLFRSVFPRYAFLLLSSPPLLRFSPISLHDLRLNLPSQLSFPVIILPKFLSNIPLPPPDFKWPRKREKVGIASFRYFYEKIELFCLIIGLLIFTRFSETHISIIDLSCSFCIRTHRSGDESRYLFSFSFSFIVFLLPFREYWSTDRSCRLLKGGREAILTFRLKKNVLFRWSAFCLFILFFFFVFENYYFFYQKNWLKNTRIFVRS